ncbi:MAG: 30S ribosomal protein S16 [Tannerella sp.]|nr:30S ribosomal protein S16 [Tannerella sp.]
MATKIRLQRHGRKGYAFYQLVVADSRAPRDGKFIERIGSYNPNTNPATIDLNFERALYWLQVGAQPTDTAHTILSREGVCLKKHLLEGVKKGAFDEAAAETKFEEWVTSKKQSLQAVRDKDREAAKAANKARLDAEKESNRVKAEAVAKKKAVQAAAAAQQAAEATAAAQAEAAAEAAATVQVEAVTEPTATAQADAAVETVVPEETAVSEETVAPAPEAAETNG